MKIPLSPLLLILSGASSAVSAQQVVEINDANSWQRSMDSGSNVSISAEGTVTPANASEDYSYRSNIIEFSSLTDAQDIVFKQSDGWDNWIPVSNIGPAGAREAPVLLSVQDGEYYFLASINGDTAYQAWSSNDMINWQFHGPVTGSAHTTGCLLYTSPSPRDLSTSRMPSSA